MPIGQAPGRLCEKAFGPHQPGHQHRRVYGIWDGWPDLTTPADALYRVAHRGALSASGDRTASETVAAQHRGRVRARCSGKVRAVAHGAAALGAATAAGDQAPAVRSPPISKS